jgi:hypothetical protein
MILKELIDTLTELETALNKLHQMTSDIEEESAPLLVRNIREETLEVMGWNAASMDAARKAQTALEQRKELEPAWHALESCNQSFLEMFNKFYGNLFTAHHIIELEKLAKKKETGHWAQTTIRDLYTCQLSLQKVCAVLLSTWKHIAEILADRVTTVHTNSIAQQFLFPEQK